MTRERLPSRLRSCAAYGRPYPRIMGSFLYPSGRRACRDCGSDSARITCRRLDQLADELGMNRERLRKWSFAQAVLSGWWSYEDHGRGWEPALAVADLLKWC